MTLSENGHVRIRNKKYNNNNYTDNVQIMIE